MGGKRLSLTDLKKSVVTRPASAAVPRQHTATRKPSRDEPVDDASAFRQAVAGATALTPTNRVELKRTPPPPVPRPLSKQDAPPEAVAPRNEFDFPEHWLRDDSNTPTSSEDAALSFALKGVVPIKTDRVFVEPPKPLPLPIQHELDEQAALAESIYAPTPLELRLEGGDELNYLKEGMPRSVLRDLRRGRWVVQSALDLHGANRDQARELLAHFMGYCRKNGVRCVRVIHGKGLGSPGKEPILKKLVAGWLMNYDDVLAYAQARVHDGGAGAMLVLLKAQSR